ncbi:hypothetical protein CRG98_008013 [Punica granatum]|uniref:No apical meristem-associated C-terminal domain-containing protein n=1 Tax=Punica granatum TaxID=22663 RepID=A0A2I0KSZ8_PUNGR|nr:hypothetical protein CRG98_008013 [Punica granatum]
MDIRVYPSNLWVAPSPHLRVHPIRFYHHLVPSSYYGQAGSPSQFMGDTESASSSVVGSDQSPHSTPGDSAFTVLPTGSLEGIDPHDDDDDVVEGASKGATRLRSQVIKAKQMKMMSWRKEPKWRAMWDPTDSLKRTKTNASGGYMASSNPDEDGGLVPPLEGRDAAKRKKRELKSSRYDDIMKMKAKEFEMRHKELEDKKIKAGLKREELVI